MPIEDAVLEVRQLQKYYGDFRAVDGLSFAVGPGEVFGLLGPNGAGKTTAIRCIMDIFKPDGGEIEVLGRSPTEVAPRWGICPRSADCTAI